jgi:hypothetical protein
VGPLHLSLDDCPSSCADLEHACAPLSATLMRSRDQSREFGDMGGKAQTIDWLVEHAADAFADPA